MLRRYSLDQLPQLVNVLKGDMSLVGPRPPLASGVERYGYDMRRRLLVKPGLRGLWQVSGRSDLSWDDSVRIDVRYVENWSLALDFLIVWKPSAPSYGDPGRTDHSDFGWLAVTATQAPQGRPLPPPAVEPDRPLPRAPQQ